MRPMSSVAGPSETGPLIEVLLKHPSTAFVDEARVNGQWKSLGYSAPPDLRRAIDEYDHFAEILQTAGAAITWLPQDDGTTLDSVYVRDAAVVCARGLILCRMGKAARSGEPAALNHAWPAFGPDVLPIIGRIEAPGTLEGGDVAWLGPRTIAVGRGYRTNDHGIAQLRGLLGDSIDEMIVVPLPHWRGAGDVMHLMSIISPVDRDLAVVYAPLLPVPFRERLVDLGIGMVEVPDEEFDSLGANVLALGPRRCLIARGNARTVAALEKAGAEVIEYAGAEISLKGAGGPTCLTRPLARKASGRTPL